MKTAKQLYKDLNTKHLSPHYQEKGWQKIGFSWQYLDQKSGNDVDVYVQKYYVDTDEQVDFTVGIDIISKEFVDWHDKLSEAKRQKEKTAPEFTGDKVTDTEGRWFGKIEYTSHWTLKPEDDLDKLRQDILDWVRTTLLPYLEQHTPVNAVIRDMITKQEGSAEPIYRPYERKYPKYKLSYYDMLIR